MNTPTITIDGKRYEPAPPTMRAWRETVEFINAEKAEWGLDTVGEKYLAYIVTGFNRPEVTAESVASNVLAADIIPLGNSLMNWVYVQILDALKQVPNAEAPEADG